LKARTYVRVTLQPHEDKIIDQARNAVGMSKAGFLRYSALQQAQALDPDKICLQVLPQVLAEIDLQRSRYGMDRASYVEMVVSEYMLNEREKEE